MEIPETKKKIKLIEEKVNLHKINLHNFFLYAPVSKEEIFQKSRKLEYIQWRSIYYLIALKETYNFSETSIELNRERTNIMHHINNLGNLLDVKDKPLMAKLTILRNNANNIRKYIKCNVIQLNSFQPQTVGI
jgi:hypothetical protein